MNQPIHLIGNVFAIGHVPDEAAGLDFNIVDDHFELTFYTMGDGEEEKELHGIPIPDGNWQLICTTREVKASNTPELFGYALIGDHYAEKTIRSLLVSQKCDPDKNYCLIKKID